MTNLSFQLRYVKHDSSLKPSAAVLRPAGSCVFEREDPTWLPPSPLLLNAFTMQSCGAFHTL